MSAAERERMAARVHEIYLATAKRLSWPVRPENDKPFAQLSEAAQALDYAIADYLLTEIRGAVAGALDRAADRIENSAAINSLPIAEWLRAWGQAYPEEPPRL